MRRVRRQVGGVGARRDGRATCPSAADPALLVGLAPFDDAAIYRLDDTTALVSTTDFFPPLVDDPADYGAIAAANACSDVFAMGGRVVLAINVAAFPEHFPRWRDGGDLRRRGGGRRRGRRHGRRRAHDPQPGAGVRPRRAGPRAPRPGVPQGRAPGRATSCCCPSRSGTGLTLAGGDDDDKAAAIAGMRHAQPRARRRRCRRSARPSTPSPTSPATASPATAGRSPSAAGRGSSSTAPGSSPTRARVEAAERGVRTGGDARNRDYVAGHLTSTASAAAEALVLDPQTSGGLLAAVDPAVAADARRPPGSGASARSRPASRRWCCGDGPAAVRPRRESAAGLQEAGADARRREGDVGPRPRGRRRHRRGRPRARGPGR